MDVLGLIGNLYFAVRQKKGKNQTDKSHTLWTDMSSTLQAPISTNKFFRPISTHFHLKIVESDKNQSISLWWSFYWLSKPFLLLMFWYCWEETGDSYHWDPLQTTLTRIYFRGKYSVKCAIIKDPNTNAPLTLLRKTNQKACAFWIYGS